MQIVPLFLRNGEAVSVQNYFASRFLFRFSLIRYAMILALLDTTTRQLAVVSFLNIHNDYLSLVGGRVLNVEIAGLTLGGMCTVSIVLNADSTTSGYSC